MQIFLEQKLAFLAVPKTGSTSYEAALRRFASIDVLRPPRIRHMAAVRFHRRWRPFLRRAYRTEVELVAVLREPVARLESWYRYRKDPKRKHRTDGLHFEGFVGAVLSEAPPPAARIGNQHDFVTDQNGAVLVDHLFVIEQPDPLRAFLEDRFGAALDVPVLNVSTDADADLALSPRTEAALFKAREAEFTLYDRVAAEGYLHTPLSVR